MDVENFKNQAHEAKECTKLGLNLLVELNELQEAIKHFPKEENLEEIIKEIIEKEKNAIKLLEKGTLIQRTLIRNHHEALVGLINNLS